RLRPGRHHRASIRDRVTPGEPAAGANEMRGAGVNVVWNGLWQKVTGALSRLEHDGSHNLGDFTTTWQLVPMSVAAIGIGFLSAWVALALLRLIGLVTNLAFFQRWNVALVSPAGHTLGWLEVMVPVAGTLV